MPLSAPQRVRPVPMVPAMQDRSTDLMDEALWVSECGWVGGRGTLAPMMGCEGRGWLDPHLMAVGERLEG